MCEPKIYVADLAAYNAGILHGVWIDASEDLEVIQTNVQAMLAKTPLDETAEEFAVHDCEGFEGANIKEYQSLASIHELACFIEEHGELGAALLNYYCDIDEAQKTIDEAYHGCYESLADYAQEFTEQTGDIPKHLELYIDYERMGNDWEMSGDIFTIETSHDEVHIFSNH